MIPLALLQSDIDRLAPLPVSLPKLASALADPMGNLAQIVHIIQYDTALTANVIRMANSAAFAPVNPILTVNDAVMRLGTGRVLELAMGNQVRGILAASCPGYELTEKELWRHSVAAALAAELLTRFATKQIPPVAFTAALLHDIGKLIISRQIKHEWRQQIADLVEAKGVPFIEAERTVLGVTHAEVGGAVAKRWSFPKVLADSIAQHHEPDSEGNSSLALDAVHIGNVVAKTLAVGMGSEQMNMVACASSARRLGLTPEKFEALCANVLEDLPKIESMFEGV